MIDWSALVGSLESAGLLGVAGAAVLWLIRKELRSYTDKLDSIDAVADRVEGIAKRVDQIGGQVFRNSGSSLADGVDRLEKTVQRMSDNSAERHAYLLAHIEDVRIATAEASAWQWLMSDIPHGVAFVEPLAIWVGDEKGSNRKTNRAYREFFGINGLDLDWLAVVDRTKNPEYIQDFMDALKTGGPPRFNRLGVHLFVVNPSTGSKESTKVNIHCTMIRDDEGRVIRTVGIVYRSSDGEA